MFKIKEHAQQYHIIAHSSNYDLYANISNRIMSFLNDFAPRLEIYSIDESFLDFTEVKQPNLNF